MQIAIDKTIAIKVSVTSLNGIHYCHAEFLVAILNGIHLKATESIVPWLHPSINELNTVWQCTVKCDKLAWIRFRTKTVFSIQPLVFLTSWSTFIITLSYCHFWHWKVSCKRAIGLYKVPVLGSPKAIQFSATELTVFSCDFSQHIIKPNIFSSNS